MKLRILHTVENYYPSVGGMQEAVKRISELLVKQGHDVTVATSSHPLRADGTYEGVRVLGFDVHGNSVEGFRGKDQQRYVKFIQESQFDVITNFAAQQWTTDLMWPLLPQLSAKKFFVPTGFSNLFSSKYQRYFLQMREDLKLYDINVFLSNHYRDANFARRMGIRNFCVIPNGADRTEFEAKYSGDIREELGIPKHHFLVTLIGSHTGKKGHREAISIFRKARIPDSTLLIIGSRAHFRCSFSCEVKSRLFNLVPGSRKIRNVVLPRPQVVAAMKASDLFLFPSNIECSPIVLYETMAAKTPFLATDVGNAREIGEWFQQSQHVLPTEIDANGFSRPLIAESAKLLRQLSENRDALRDRGERGHEIWRESFTWERVASMYEHIYLNTEKQAIAQ